MPQTTITVAGIAPPGEGKKQGKITDTAGGVWNVWGDKIPNYRMGVTYEIKYEENEFKGKKFFVIQNAEPAGQAASQAAQARPSPAGISQSQLGPKDKEIWVCALLKEAIGNPNVDPFNLDRAKYAELGKTFFDLYDYLFAKKLPVQRQAPVEDDMDDEIPF